MSSNPTCVTLSSDLLHAAALMHDADVSSLPVTDELGRCVGIITASDFVERFADYATQTQSLAGQNMRLTNGGAHNSLLMEVIPEDEIRIRMSPALQTIEPEASVRSAMRMMISTSLHHLVVIDESVRPVGIVSSLDILRALFY
jgi:CBS domain-containing membrane protein